SVADTFREAAKTRVARLPTADDRRRFLDAARGILALDEQIKNLPQRRRSALLNAPIESARQEAEITAALKAALPRVVTAWREASAVDPEEIKTRLAMIRVLLGALVAPGLNSASDGATLREAALQLRELSSNAHLLISQRGAREGRRETLSET